MSGCVRLAGHDGGYRGVGCGESGRFRQSKKEGIHAMHFGARSMRGSGKSRFKGVLHFLDACLPVAP